MNGTEKTEKPVRGKNGGARPGAGMPKGKKTRKTVLKEKAQEYLMRRVQEEIEPLFNALKDKALTGDIPAIKEALERGLGKVKEVKDVNITDYTPILGGKTVR